MTIGTSIVKWLPCWRIIPSRFPPIQLFERIANPDDWEAVIAIESMTNPRLRDEIGDIQLVPPNERVSGPGTSIIMAAFTHLNPEGSRFTDGEFGVFYASETLDTAIRETVYHRENFMRATSQLRMELDQRVYLIDLDAELHDIRGKRDSLPLLYHPDNYSASQHLARTLRDHGSNGIAYDSVRHEKGRCVGIFRPKVLSNCRQERHLCYVWDGQKIGDVYEKRSLT
jgi:hypothetical protein